MRCPCSWMPFEVPGFQNAGLQNPRCTSQQPLAARGQVNLVNMKGQNALHLAAHGGVQSVLAWLASKMDPEMLQYQDPPGPPHRGLRGTPFSQGAVPARRAFVLVVLGTAHLSSAASDHRHQDTSKARAEELHAKEASALYAQRCTCLQGCIHVLAPLNSVS